MTKKICIIDDDEDVRDIMAYALENEGIQTFLFKNAKIALEELSLMDSDDYPALIIVDFLMPEMNGITFVERVFKEHPLTLAKIPIALSTANGKVEGMDSLPPQILKIPKPIDLDDFLDMVQKYVK
jgi:two-component system, OmpR family, phosphate regulon response regulator PhoB